MSPQQESAPLQATGNRLIVVYRDGSARKRVIWSQGETLNFPAPFNCIGVRRDGQIRVLSQDGVEIFKLSEKRACEDGAEVWVPASGSPAGSRQKFNYIHILPELELALTGVFHHQRARRKKGSNRTRSIQIERKAAPRKSDRPSPSGNRLPLRAEVPPTLRKQGVRKQAASHRKANALGEFWRSFWKVTAVGGIGAMAILVLSEVGAFRFRGDLAPAVASIQPVALVPAASATRESTSSTASNGAFSARSARELKAAIRGARSVKAVAPSSERKRRVATNAARSR